MKSRIIIAIFMLASFNGVCGGGQISPGIFFQGGDNWAGRIDYFNDQAGKAHPLIGYSVTWTYEFGVNWPDYIAETVKAGSVPMMTWMSCVDDIMDSDYPLQKIIDGAFDDYIRRSAKTLKNYNTRILCRFDQEMNLNIWAWSVTAPWNNGDPKQYVAMWRHVVDIFKEEGVTNVEWIWCPNAMSYTLATWNDVNNYYPGDGCVDWIGLDGYSWGSANTSGNAKSALSFPCIFDPIVRDFQCTYKKPIILCETGCLEDARYPKPKWIGDAYDYLFQYSFIKGIVWLNSYNPETGMEEDFRVIRMYDDKLGVPEIVTSAYRNALTPESFITYLPTLEQATPSELACNPLPRGSEYPKHEILLNKSPGSIYRTGDVLAPAYFVYSATNPANMFVDPYVVVKLPNNTYYSYTKSGFVRGIVPAATGFAVKRESRSMTFYYTFSGSLPEGAYILYSGLVRKGQSALVAANRLSFDQDPFTYQR